MLSSKPKKISVFCVFCVRLRKQLKQLQQLITTFHPRLFKSIAFSDITVIGDNRYIVPKKISLQKNVKEEFCIFAVILKNTNGHCQNC